MVSAPNGSRRFFLSCSSVCGHGHALHHVSRETIEPVAHMSPASIDRALAAARDGLPRHVIEEASCDQDVFRLDRH
jgi:hypothetical protein